MARRKTYPQVTPGRPSDFPEPIKTPKLIREWHVGSSVDAANILIAAAELGFDVTIDSYHGLVDNKGTTQHAFHIRMWDEQTWSACLLPRPEDTRA